MSDSPQLLKTVRNCWANSSAHDKTRAHKLKLLWTHHKLATPGALKHEQEQDFFMYISQSTVSQVCMTWTTVEIPIWPTREQVRK